jgi:2-methylisocitrate lyase-like PEP mutase family enzyme
VTQEEKGRAFHALHEGDPFVIPNPWDVGSARMLAALDFRALATTSSGFAFTLGRRDGEVTLEELAAHVRAVESATELPVSVDLENGLADDAGGVAAAIERVAEAGAVGASIEDWEPNGGRLYERGEAVERLAAAVEAADSLPFPFMLVGRAENHIRGNPDLDDTIARLCAYQEVGVEVLYAPGLASVEDIRHVCSAVSKPVNVLARPNLTFAEIAGAGAQRVSVGGSLAWTGVNVAAAAAEAIRDRGDFSSLGSSPPLDDWFR